MPTIAKVDCAAVIQTNGVINNCVGDGLVQLHANLHVVTDYIVINDVVIAAQ